jgi:HD superfamily phosphohydrolase
VGQSLREKVRALAPHLCDKIDSLCRSWISPAVDRFAASELRPKQFNDAVWGTIELYPWEVAIIDTRMLQRMRGVRQLGLAYLVFPGAVHDRLEHIIGVVGVTDLMVTALNRQIHRWNQDQRQAKTTRLLPEVTEEERYRLRLAAIFHDLGHGPFSHAVEPVLEVNSPLGYPAEIDADQNWRAEIAAVRTLLKEEYVLNEAPAPAEIMSIMIILSPAVHDLLDHQRLNIRKTGTVAELQEQLVACVIGAIEGPGADHLTTVISSQLDADRMDYLARDAHHAGLEIGFDTSRLMSRLEIHQLRDDNTPGADDTLRERLAKKAPDSVLQIGIAASGFGSFEQMLIGRTFLYDRLYHHHKVRAAEAMAQRMLLVEERDRGRRLELEEIFLPVGDDVLLNILAQTVTHPGLPVSSDPAALLAQGILDRRLLHRAYAFRARFVAMPQEIGEKEAEETRSEQWRRILKDLESLADRYRFGVKIFEFAVSATAALMNALPIAQRQPIAALKDALEKLGPEHVIVDVPRRKADAIRVFARYPDGMLKVPEFSFNPIKWADAYDLQKRTGYVFCPQEILPIIALAARVLFLTEFGVVMDPNADGYIKAGKLVDPSWLAVLAREELIDQTVADRLQTNKVSLLGVQRRDVGVPEAWVRERPDLPAELASEIKRHLKSGLVASDLQAFRKVMEAMFAFMDSWYDGGSIAEDVSNEADLQARLMAHLRARSVKVSEGAVAGGGKYDLFVEDAVLIENKYSPVPADSLQAVKPGAGAQGRRYAIALRSLIVFSVAAVKVKAGEQPPQRSDTIEVRNAEPRDGNRVEIRYTVPYGATVPSRQAG